MKLPVTTLAFFLLIAVQHASAWGFYAHRTINYQAVFLLPPGMMTFYKQHIEFLSEHAVDPDKRRYIVTGEGPRHFIDLDQYGNYPFKDLPQSWNGAVEKYGEEHLLNHGIVPWWIQIMHQRLTRAFQEKNFAAILKLSAELGHYIADAHVPLHAHSNYNGQQTGQQGIHAFWESRIPELLAGKEFDYFIGKAVYIPKPGPFIRNRILESFLAADTVLQTEKQLSREFPPDQKYAYEERNGSIIRQYASSFTIAFNQRLQGMVERRMRQSIFGIASFWYTAWINAGQPSLQSPEGVTFSPADLTDFEELNLLWKSGDSKGRSCEN